MRLFINKLFIAVLCLGAGLLAAQEPVVSIAANPEPSKDYATCLAKWDTHLNTLYTHFTQITQYDGMMISQSKGRIIYAQKGPKLRLDNLEDTQITQTALTNKKQIYIFDDKGKEVSKISWAEWLAGQPNQALFDFGNYTALLAKHKVSLFKEDQTQAVLRLEPKKQDANGYTLYVTVKADTCFPIIISIEADLMTTTAQLEQPQINQPLEENTFKGLK